MDDQLERDEAGFARLVQKHRRELRVHCYRLMGAYDESEDLVQETLLRAWQGWPAFQERSSFRTWLYRIATNACLSELTQRSRRPRTVSTQPPMELGSGADEPDTALTVRESTELVWLLVIRRLPARQRMVLTLRDVLGWPAKATAELLGMTVPSANSRLQRARTTLREQFDQWDADAEPKPDTHERALLRCYLTVLSRPDPAALAELVSTELSGPPHR